MMNTVYFLYQDVCTRLCEKELIDIVKQLDIWPE